MLNDMVPIFYWYIGLWSTACLIALGIFARDPAAMAIGTRAYWRFLFVRWKLGVFLVAAAGLALMAPYTSDPTWDYIDASFMSVLTYLTAPWATGVFYKVIRRELPLKQAYVAGCVAMFSTSWSYDLYMLLRIGRYPATWQSNIVASLFLYLMAGLLWNLELRPGRGVIFAFMEQDWLRTSPPAAWSRIVYYALFIVVLVTVMMLPFLRQ